MTRIHRNEDRGGEHRWTFNGVEYPTRKLMCEARRAEYVRLLDEEGMNFTQVLQPPLESAYFECDVHVRLLSISNRPPLMDWLSMNRLLPSVAHNAGNTSSPLLVMTGI